MSLRHRKVDVRLPGKGNSNSHGARPVHLIITVKTCKPKPTSGLDWLMYYKFARLRVSFLSNVSCVVRILVHGILALSNGSAVKRLLEILFRQGFPLGNKQPVLAKLGVGYSSRDGPPGIDEIYALGEMKIVEDSE